ncbi:hypothetical protein Bpfe_002784, partial [Biomphalaria pfeifferi]
MLCGDTNYLLPFQSDRMAPQCQVYRKHHSSESVFKMNKLENKPKTLETKKNKIASGIPCKIKETDENYESNPLKQEKLAQNFKNTSMKQLIKSFTYKDVFPSRLQPVLKKVNMRILKSKPSRKKL